MLVDLGNVIIRQFLEFLLRMLSFVLGNSTIMSVLLELVHGISAHMTDSDTTVLGHFANDFDEFLPAFLAKFWKEDTNSPALDGRGKAEVAFLDSLFDRVKRVGIPWLDRES